MVKNLPDTSGVATALIATKPHVDWRRDPESNRARRICNPEGVCSEVPLPLGRGFAWPSWTARFAFSCPKNYLTPDAQSFRCVDRNPTCMKSHVLKSSLSNVRSMDKNCKRPRPALLPRDGTCCEHGERGPRPFSFPHVLSAGLTKQRTMSRWPTRAGMPYMTPTARPFAGTEENQQADRYLVWPTIRALDSTNATLRRVVGHFWDSSSDRLAKDLPYRESRGHSLPEARSSATGEKG